jgi:hypothetical protein
MKQHSRTCLCKYAHTPPFRLPLQACFVPQLQAAYLSLIDKCYKKRLAQQAVTAKAMEEGAAAVVALPPEVNSPKQRSAVAIVGKDPVPCQQSNNAAQITVICTSDVL